MCILIGHVCLIGKSFEKRVCDGGFWVLPIETSFVPSNWKETFLNDVDLFTHSSCLLVHLKETETLLLVCTLKILFGLSKEARLIEGKLDHISFFDSVPMQWISPSLY